MAHVNSDGFIVDAEIETIGRGTVDSIIDQIINGEPTAHCPLCMSSNIKDEHDDAEHCEYEYSGTRCQECKFLFDEPLMY